MASKDIKLIKAIETIPIKTNLLYLCSVGGYKVKEMFYLLG